MQLRDYLSKEVPRASTLLRADPYHSYSRDLITRNEGRQFVELYTTYTVKLELNRLVSEPKIMEEKIISKLCVSGEISKLSKPDQKLLLPIIYRAFFLELPRATHDLLDRLNSKSVGLPERNLVLDELLQRVFRPIFRRKKLLMEHIELSGQPKLYSSEVPEYRSLCYILDRFGDWDKNRDVQILAEAICCFRNFKEQYREPPDFFFVSNDRLFRPSGEPPYFEILRLVNEIFGITLATPKRILETAH